MKSSKEILGMLVHELLVHFEKAKYFNKNVRYFNEALGDTSFLLSGLLDSLLQTKSGWDKSKWIDDSLITSVNQSDNKLILEGVMIWGKTDTTQQWTDPFCFEMDIIKKYKDFNNFTFFFCDVDNREITYEEFIENRDYWVSSQRRWKYIINSNKALPI